MIFINMNKETVILKPYLFLQRAEFILDTENRILEKSFFVVPLSSRIYTQ